MKCRYQEPKNKGGRERERVYGGRGGRTNQGSDERQIYDMQKGTVWWTSTATVSFQSLD